MAKIPWDDAIKAAKKAAARNAKKKITYLERPHRGDIRPKKTEMEKLLDKWLREQKKKGLKTTNYNVPPRTPKPKPSIFDKRDYAERKRMIREIEKHMRGEGGAGTRVVRRPTPKKPSGSAAKRVPSGRR